MNSSSYSIRSCNALMVAAQLHHFVTDDTGITSSAMESFAYHQPRFARKGVAR